MWNQYLERPDCNLKIKRQGAKNPLPCFGILYHLIKYVKKLISHTLVTVQFANTCKINTFTACIVKSL